MADYQEYRASRGRLFYTAPNTDSPHEHPVAYYRPRASRPQILRVGNATGESLYPVPGAVEPSWKIIKFSKLADSRDNAKKFFRFVTSSQSTSDPARRNTSPSGADLHSSCRRSVDQSSIVDMQLGETGRNIHKRSRPQSVVGGPVSGMVHRPSLVENVRSGSMDSRQSITSTSPSIIPTIADEKPLASGNGVSISIALAEPVLYLQGFDHQDVSNCTTTMLRGSLHLKVLKSAKIKAVTLRFRGRAETEWPEGAFEQYIVGYQICLECTLTPSTGIPPRKVEFRDVESIMNHTWPFFNAQFQTAELGHGADNVQPLKGPTSTVHELSLPGVTSSSFDQFQRSSRVMTELSARDAKRLSLQLNHSRSFGKGESANGGPSVAQKGYRTFTPGDYIYNFELPIDSRLPETIEVELGKVKYELEAIVERAGAFRANLLGSKEVTLIRAPAENSLETVEPIAISRDWEDQLHYDIVISGKSFPLGAQVPIAFKLTPLAKVQCHRIKVFVTENIQYYTSNKRVHRLEPTRKIQLFEKRADAPSVSAYPGSTVRITAGGGVAYDEREAAARGDESVPRDATNLLGNLDGEHNVGPTEMEFNVQLPSCHAMQEKDKAARLHFDTTYQGIQVHHWIKIVMRLSKPDTDDPTKRRHFEISIDSPFNILSCRATQANTALPAYSSPESVSDVADQFECGCPDAPRRRNTSLFSASTMSSLRSVTNVSSGAEDPIESLARPPAAHVHDQDPGVSRPIHLLRVPSFNPPPFNDDDPPPPMVTPPPSYDTLISGDPGSGLADYFARLADDLGDDEDGVTSPSRIDLPLTPGGRINRSMDEQRTWEPLGRVIAQ
ncbi:hypothetical protein MMC11_004418 [Xylographa trunciseda]|nr:hypothetical protein [Xylographa trunciseda]